MTRKLWYKTDTDVSMMVKPESNTTFTLIMEKVGLFPMIERGSSTRTHKLFLVHLISSSTGALINSALEIDNIYNLLTNFIEGPVNPQNKRLFW